MAKTTDTGCVVCYVQLIRRGVPESQYTGWRYGKDKNCCSPECARIHYQARDRAAGVAVITMKLEEIREILDMRTTLDE